MKGIALKLLNNSNRIIIIVWASSVRILENPLLKERIQWIILLVTIKVLLLHILLQILIFRIWDLMVWRILLSHQLEWVIVAILNKNYLVKLILVILLDLSKLPLKKNLKHRELIRKIQELWTFNKWLLEEKVKDQQVSIKNRMSWNFLISKWDLGVRIETYYKN